MVRNRIYLYSQPKGETGLKELRVPTNVSLIKLENRGSGSVTASGTTERGENAVFFPLGGVKVNDFSNTTSFAQGIYNIEVSGLDYVRFNLDSASDVYITLIG